MGGVHAHGRAGTGWFLLSFPTQTFPRFYDSDFDSSTTPALPEQNEDLYGENLDRKQLPELFVPREQQQVQEKTFSGGNP